MAQSAVEALAVGIVDWLARVAEVELDTALVGPFVHHLGDELAAVVNAQ
jgi:hypothetical protein